MTKEVGWGDYSRDDYSKKYGNERLRNGAS